MTSFTDLRALEEFKSWLGFAIVAFVIAVKNLLQLIKRSVQQKKTKHQQLKMGKLHTFDTFMYGAIVFFIAARFAGLYNTEGRSPSDLMEPMVRAMYDSRDGGP